MQEILIARQLRLATIHQLWKSGQLAESDARELLAGPLTPGDDSTIYDDSRFLDDFEGLTRQPEQRNDAETGIREACPADRHDYYTAFLSYLFCPYCGERLHS
jgi:hypothetical protein